MSENGNPTKKQRNPRSLANLRPPFSGQPGPGRPPLPPQIKADREDAKQILKDNSAKAARRLAELVDSRDPDVAIKASDGILKRTVPVLEEVTNHDDRPLQVFSDEQLTAKLREIESSRASHTNGNGASAQ